MNVSSESDPSWAGDFGRMWRAGHKVVQSKTLDAGLAAADAARTLSDGTRPGLELVSGVSLRETRSYSAVPRSSRCARSDEQRYCASGRQAFPLLAGLGRGQDLP